MVLLGWRPPLATFGYDGLAAFLLPAAELARASGDWDSVLWRAHILGGVALRDTIGPFPPLAWLARLGLGPTSMLNGSAFLLQAVIAFLSLRAATDLAHGWLGSRPRLGWLLRLAAVWLCGFAPVLGWRLSNGHQTLIAGMLPFFSAVSLLAAAAVGSGSVVLTLVAAGAAACGLLFTGHQMVLYGAVFGGPILLGLWLASGRRVALWLRPALALLGAFLIALPSLWGPARARVRLRFPARADGPRHRLLVPHRNAPGLAELCRVDTRGRSSHASRGAPSRDQLPDRPRRCAPGARAVAQGPGAPRGSRGERASRLRVQPRSPGRSRAHACSS